MSLNKHKIIPLIESYYHTFTPLERTIADFFIHNTEEQDFSSKNISGLLYVSEASLSRFVTLRDTDGGTGFMHESFHKDNPSDYTRSWFAWTNTLFGELIVKLQSEGKLKDLLG